MRSLLWLAAVVIALVVGLAPAPRGAAQSGEATERLRLAPYYPSPAPVVDKMLELGELKAGELLYDLGSGDGRVVIAAARQYGARAVGFEIDANLVESSRAAIEELGLAPLARIEQRDLRTADFSKPDLITVYLLPSSNEKLRPLLEQQMKSGARVVVHDFPFEVWEPEEQITVEDTTDPRGLTHTLYLYRR